MGVEEVRLAIKILSKFFFFLFNFYSSGLFQKSTPPRHRPTSKTLELLIRTADVLKMFAVAIVSSLPPTTGLARVLQHIGGPRTLVFRTWPSARGIFHAGFWEPCVNVALVNLLSSV